MGRNSLAVYKYLHTTAVPRRNVPIWEFYFASCIDFYAQQLRSIRAATPGRRLWTYDFNPLTMHVNTIQIGAAGIDAEGYAMTLSSRDLEYLIAIADLIGSIGRCPDVASNMLMDYDPIKRLFSLLSCPVPIVLKGALFRALAALAFGNAECARQIWISLEEHRLLFPVASSYSAMPVGTRIQAPGGVDAPLFNTTPGGGNDVREFQNGLKYELEATESTAGVYPCTEGFLQLLEGLFAHGVPENLGTGYRIPGMIAYLEFIIDDVLKNAKSRFYAPRGVGGESQRWQITARAVHILSQILQHYAINALPADGYVPSSQAQQPLSGDANHSGFWISRTELVGEIAADFTNTTIKYKLMREDGVTLEQMYPCRKTSGFVLMAMLLGGAGPTGSAAGTHSRLMSIVLSLLEECQLPAMQAARDSVAAVGRQSAISVAGIMQPPEKPPINYGLDEDLSGVSLGSDADLTCDTSYWMEKTVSACMGLLYECGLREQMFTRLVRQSAQPLSFIRNEHGRPAAVPVLSQGLAEVLSSSIHLSKISHYLQLQSHRVCNVPSVPAMVANILEIVALNQQAHLLLGSLHDSSQGLRDISSACVRVICDPVDRRHEGIIPRVSLTSADAFPPYIFSPSQMATTEAPLHPLGAVSAILSGDNPDYLSELTAREAILSLLLTSLTTERAGMGLSLLGLTEYIERVQYQRMDALQVAASMPDPNLENPTNCLEAILSIISPAHENDAGSAPLFLIQPDIACLCYEILYRLCSMSNTSVLVLAYLRKRSIQFVSVQLKAFSRWLNASDESLVRSVQAVQQMGVGASEEELPGEQVQVKVEDVKTARHHCCAYVVQVCALELRALDLGLSHDISEKKVASILSCLFGTDPGDSGIPDNTLPIIRFLQSAYDMPDDNFPVIGSTLVLRCLEEATVMHEFAKRDRIQIERAASNASHKPEDVYVFNIVDITLFIRLVDEKQVGMRAGGYMNAAASKADIEAGVKAAIQMNLYQQRVAAATHLCKAWGQLVDIALLGGSANVLLGTTPKTQYAAVGSLVDSFLLPTLQILSSPAATEMIMGEKIIRSVLTMITSFRRLNGDAEMRHLMPVGPDQYYSLLQALLSVLLSKGSKHITKPNTSVYFRGYVYNSLCQLLALPSSDWLDGPSVYSPHAARSDGDEPSSFEEAKGYSPEKMTSNESNSAEMQARLQEIKARQVMVLESSVVETATALGRDATSGPLIWRISAIAALTAMLASLAPSSDPGVNGSDSADNGYAQTSPSAGYLIALQTIASKGSLMQLVALGMGGDDHTHSAGEHNALVTVAHGALAGEEYARRADEERNEGLFESVCALCVQVAASREGVEELTRCGVIRRLCGLNHLHAPLSDVQSDLESSLRATPSERAQIASQLRFETQFLSVLRVLQAMASTSPTRIVLEGCLQFMRSHHATVTYFLRVRSHSLGGLSVTRAVVALLATAAAAPESTVQLPQPSADPFGQTPTKKQRGADGSAEKPSAGSSSAMPFESVLGHYADSFTADVCKLLQIIGSDPIPAPPGSWQSGSGLSGASNRAPWWTRIHPAPYTAEMEYAQLPCSQVHLGSDSGLTRQWTLFDERKMRVGIDVIRQASVLLRVRAEVWISRKAPKSVLSHQPVEAHLRPRVGMAGLSGNGSADEIASLLALSGLTAIDFPTVVQVFCACASPVLRRGAVDPQKTAMHWLSSSSLPHPTESGVGEETADISGLSSTGDVVSPSLLFVSENLICVLHAMVLAFTAASMDAVPRGADADLDSCLQLAKKFPQHSFIRSVARWVADKLDRIE